MSNDLISALRRVIAGRITLKTIAERTGIPYRSLQNYFSGKSRIPADAFLKIAGALGVEADYLVTGNFLPSHPDLYDAVLAVLGDVLPNIDLEKGQATLRRAASEDRSHKLAMATLLSLRLAEEYDRVRKQSLNSSTAFPPRQTAKEYVASETKRRSKRVGQ